VNIAGGSVANKSLKLHSLQRANFPPEFLQKKIIKTVAMMHCKEPIPKTGNKKNKFPVKELCGTVPISTFMCL
jgi:hypothetical protein